MRTNYIKTTEKLSEFKLGDTREYKVYGVNIFRLRKARRVPTYAPLFTF
ncbi:MAG: hypothetical protein IJ309_04260 [Clostridia bacterium]|nr:hypothetical protein [Clostridia bacterium]